MSRVSFVYPPLPLYCVIYVSRERERVGCRAVHRVAAGQELRRTNLFAQHVHLHTGKGMVEVWWGMVGRGPCMSGTGRPCSPYALP